MDSRTESGVTKEHLAGPAYSKVEVVDQSRQSAKEENHRVVRRINCCTIGVRNRYNTEVGHNDNEVVQNLDKDH